MKKHKPQFAKIKPNDTTTDEIYQREFEEARARAMAADFDPMLMGVPVLARRHGGKLVRIDAQHRLAAAIFAGLGDVPTLCEIYEGLAIEEEAELFLRLNGGRKAVRAYDKFRARIVAKEPVAVEICAVLSSLKLKFQKAQARNSVCAVQALDAVHHRGNLRETLETIKAWADGEPASFDHALIKAVSFFLTEYGKEVVGTDLAAKMRAHAPSRVVTKLRRTKEQFDCSAKLAACLALRDIYNERRKTNKLRAPAAMTTAVAA